MTTTVNSDRGNRICVELQSDYWGEDIVNSGTYIGADEIRVDAYDSDAHLTLTAVEARALAAALLAAADRLEPRQAAA